MTHHFYQFYLGCLAHASYLIGCDGEAAIVDPQRDVDEYIEEARRRRLTICYIIETHLHADFVSGHRELAARTGAKIVFGAGANAAFPHMAVRDGDILRLGRMELHAIETPGHTPESISWLVTGQGIPSRLLTGDTLFVGDVGRPDLAGARGYTAEEMAGMLYDSLHAKIITLPDDVEVWPAHGAGSACGRNISKETSSTIGVQRRTNYALQPMTREDFVNLLTSSLPAPPPYFPRSAETNRLGARSLADIVAAPLSLDSVREELNRGTTVLDVREAGEFGAGHVTGAINVGLDGQFASWCGTLLSIDAPVVIIASDDATAAEAVKRLARVGIENITGYATVLDELPLASIPQMTVRELHDSPMPVLDVRRRAEFASGHVPEALNVPLDELPHRLGELDRHERLAVLCEGGYRSSTACSLLAREGFANIINVIGGTQEWVNEGFETSHGAPMA